MAGTLLWYDLETFGRDPRRSRIAQFAAIRTDHALEPVGEPVSLFCRPADDLLPSPGATLITGITPQRALAEGLREADFIGRVAEEMAQPGTCTVGYNSLRFDDEFVRCGLYRCFHDPYEREWKNGNSRWDLLDVLRLAYALRPEGLEWPLRDDGAASFRLEDLAVANGVRDGDAHEALSDVRATLALARRLRDAQPRLWQWAFESRDKRSASGRLDVAGMTPVLHVSSRYPAANRCASLVVPLTQHPRIPSRIVVCSLDQDPDTWLGLAPDEIADRLYTPTADLPEGVQRVPLKEVHVNKCPQLVPLAHLRAEDFERLGIDRDVVLARAERLRAEPGLAETVRRVYAAIPERTAGDADGAIYDGFATDTDKRLFPQVRAASPSQLAEYGPRFGDPRYAELLFRYRARNWPDTLDAVERERWDDYRRRRLAPGSGLSEYDFDSHRAEIAALRATTPPGPKHAWLDELEAWARELQRSLS